MLPLLLLFPLTLALANPLLPWQITHLGTHSPSGRAGNSPYSSLFLSITDPNTLSLGRTRSGPALFPPSTVNCTLKWLAYGGEQPYGRATPCTAIGHGRWTVEMVRANHSGYGGSGTTDFVVGLRLEESIILNEGAVSLVFGGAQGFWLSTEDGNLFGSCGGSGVCNWGLKNGTVLVTQELVEARCLGNTGCVKIPDFEVLPGGLSGEGD
ncbi:hypothetical protein B0H67DRAFT_497478 [Lasiosphaeris hirsuta]|uniref:Uncharacterized protein n=1 Tax=Lasiosphaeris hirsuta TaxID=260670 RepID=A0AA39ZVP4_9PEZI|nr:hypothetical protein B0H67DRAFT_497478 [Lasiosphaeris hirsuta]